MNEHEIALARELAMPVVTAVATGIAAWIGSIIRRMHEDSELRRRTTGNFLTVAKATRCNHPIKLDEVQAQVLAKVEANSGRRLSKLEQQKVLLQVESLQANKAMPTAWVEGDTMEGESHD
jgi:hypothetical protein